MGRGHTAPALRNSEAEEDDQSPPKPERLRAVRDQQPAKQCQPADKLPQYWGRAPFRCAANSHKSGNSHDRPFATLSRTRHWHRAPHPQPDRPRSRKTRKPRREHGLICAGRGSSRQRTDTKAAHPVNDSPRPARYRCCPGMTITSATVWPRHMSSRIVRLIKFGGRTR